MAYFPKALTELVEEYLTDGIISSKERDVLLKKAVKMGVDIDEFDLYIDAQQQKVDQSIDAAARKKRGAVCPFCGGPVPQLVDKCPHCEQFITAQASEELKEILEKLEDAMVDLKSNRNIERNKAIVEKYSRKARLYYSNNPKIKPLLAEIEEDVINAQKEARAKEKKERDRKRAEERSRKFEELSKIPWFWFGVIGVVGFLLALLGGFDINKPIGTAGICTICGAGYAAAMYAMHKAAKSMDKNKSKEIQNS